MKANITKIITLVLCSLIFTSAIAAQEKPRASEFATVEYLNNEKNLPLVYDKLTSFIEHLEQEPATTRGFIRIAQNGELAKKLILIISANPRVADRIIFFGNLKYPQILEGSVGFYLIPIDAEIPYGSVDEPIECPTLSVSGEKSFSPLVSSALVFTTNVRGGENDAVITYHWKVSAGRIVEGQDTPTIKVDAAGTKEIVATVKISGVSDECMREASFTMERSGKPELIDEFGLEIFDISQARLDNFIAVLTNNPTAQGYLINYTGRFENQRAFAKRIEQIKTYFKFRAEDTNVNPYYIDTSRLTFVNGGFREEVATELWLSFDDNQKPVPTPTVDKRFVKASKPKSKPRK